MPKEGEQTQASVKAVKKLQHAAYQVDNAVVIGASKRSRSQVDSKGVVKGGLEAFNWVHVFLSQFNFQGAEVKAACDVKPYLHVSPNGCSAPFDLPTVPAGAQSKLQLCSLPLCGLLCVADTFSLPPTRQPFADATGILKWTS